MKEKIKQWIREYKLNVMKRRAMNLYKITGKQHLVVRVDNWKRAKFVITNAESHKKYNIAAKKLGKPQISYIQLLQTAVFKTLAGNFSLRT